VDGELENTRDFSAAVVIHSDSMAQNVLYLGWFCDFFQQNLAALRQRR